ncbi:MAG: hypothetical protein KAS94_11225 [Desulfobulbaceae bacterium]|nr:hypothetical protein [Desulfobulbaceae bacterium]
MKSIIFLVVVIFGVATNASCTEISATIIKTSHYTIITCSPVGAGEIEKAYLSIYATEDQPLSFSRQKMNVSYDNKASYVLRGTHAVIEGECKFVLAGNNKILREEFLASIK